MEGKVFSMSVIVGLLIVAKASCSALPRNSEDVQKRMITYYTPNGETVQEEISFSGDTVEVDTADMTVLSNAQNGLNVMIFKNENTKRCYVSARASLPLEIGQELQNDVIEAKDEMRLKFIDTGVEADINMLDDVAHKKCKGVPVVWALVSVQSKDGDGKDETDTLSRRRRSCRFCYYVCLNGHCYNKCVPCG